MSNLLLRSHVNRTLSSLFCHFLFLLGAIWQRHDESRTPLLCFDSSEMLHRFFLPVFQYSAEEVKERKKKFWHTCVWRNVSRWRLAVFNLKPNGSLFETNRSLWLLLLLLIVKKFSLLRFVYLIKLIFVEKAKLHVLLSLISQRTNGESNWEAWPLERSPRKSRSIVCLCHAERRRSCSVQLVDRRWKQSMICETCSFWWKECDDVECILVVGIARILAFLSFVRTTYK